MQEIALYTAMLWLITIGPWVLLTMIGATLSGRGYAFSLTDVMNGTCIFALLVGGLPPLAL